MGMVLVVLAADTVRTVPTVVLVAAPAPHLGGGACTLLPLQCQRCSLPRMVQQATQTTHHRRTQNQREVATVEQVPTHT